jgi:hypothetical protein
MGTPETNISTEHQPKGSALNPSDTLDRENEYVEPGQRQWNDDSAEKPETAQNAGARRGGETAGGIQPQPGDPTDPGTANVRAADRDKRRQAQGFGDDGPRSTEGT